jgi:hypothetical protein
MKRSQFEFPQRNCQLSPTEPYHSLSSRFTVLSQEARNRQALRYPLRARVH